MNSRHQPECVSVAQGWVVIGYCYDKQLSNSGTEGLRATNVPLSAPIGHNNLPPAIAEKDVISGTKIS